MQQETSQTSKFKTREEYEAWKAQKTKESEEKRQASNIGEIDISNYYQILELKSGASKEEIKQSYKDLLNVWNPSRFNDEPQLKEKASAKIKEIDDAYENLILHLSSLTENPSPSAQKKNASSTSQEHNQSSSAKEPQLGSRSNYSNTVTPSAQKAVGNRLGFGWGNLLIVISFLQGGLAFFLGFIGGVTTDIIPNRGIGLLLGLFGLSLGIGLLKRKKFGLYLVYVNSIGWIFSGLFMIAQGTDVSIVSGLFVIVLWALWWRYFQRRKELFR